MKIKKEDNSVTFMIVASVVIGCIAVIVNFMWADVRIKKNNELSTQMTEEKRKLASLQLKKETEEYAHGSFVYGYGYYSSGQKQKTYYVFYEEQPEGGYRLVKLDTDDVLLCPELKDYEQPYEIITRDGFGYIERRQMYLPENSIKASYDADISGMDE